MDRCEQVTHPTHATGLIDNQLVTIIAVLEGEITNPLVARDADTLRYTLTRLLPKGRQRRAGEGAN